MSGSTVSSWCLILALIDCINCQCRTLPIFRIASSRPRSHRGWCDSSYNYSPTTHEDRYFNLIRLVSNCHTGLVPVQVHRLDLDRSRFPSVRLVTCWRISPRLILEFSHSVQQIHGFNRSLRLGIIFGDTAWQISVRDSDDPELLLRLSLCCLGCLGLSNSNPCLLWRRIRRIPALVVARRVGPVVWVRFGFLTSLLDSSNAICWHMARGSAAYFFQALLHHFGSSTGFQQIDPFVGYCH